jgi:glutathione S-transferase
MGDTVEVKLLGVPASHPVLAAELMLQRKGIAYTRRDLPSMSQRLLLPLLRWPERTVPALTIDGRRVQTTMKIARALEELQPEPRLVPDDARVLETEAWADDVLQDNARWTCTWAAKHDSSALLPIALASRMVIPDALLRATMPVLAPLVLSFAKVSDQGAERRLAELPAHLDRVDALLAEGVLGSVEPNVADYQVATSVRLLMNLEQVRPFIERRPAGRLALALAPEYPGAFGPVFPEEWLAPLRAAD